MRLGSLVVCLFTFFGSYASVQDSLGMEKDTITDITYVKYFVEPGETIYALSTSYGVSISRLMEINPELEDGLKVGQVLLIPYNEEFFARKQAKEKEENIVTHEVQPGETLYSISRKYNVGIGEILKWNGMELKAGQKIVVGSSTTPQVASAKPVDSVKENSEPVKEEPKGTTISTVSSASVAPNEEVKEPVEVVIPTESVKTYNYDPSLRQIMIIPFDPHLYFSDADDAIAEVSNIPRVKVREVFRRRTPCLAHSSKLPEL